MGLRRARCRLGHGELQARQPHGLGLQVSPGLGDEVSLPVLGGDVGQRCRELLRETARAHEMVVHAGSINRDHVHMLLSIPPSLSVSRAVQYLKGRSSHKLLSEFASLRKRYWGQHLWARGYWVASSGNVTDEVWAEVATLFPCWKGSAGCASCGSERSPLKVRASLGRGKCSRC